MTRQLGGRRDREVDREFFLNIQLFGRFQDFLFVIYVFLHLWRRRATKEIDMPRRVPPPRDQGKLATVARAAPKSAIEKSAYMTRDAVRRLKKAKKAAKSILVSGGTLADAAQAAQAYERQQKGTTRMRRTRATMTSSQSRFMIRYSWRWREERRTRTMMRSRIQEVPLPAARRARVVLQLMATEVVP